VRGGGLGKVGGMILPTSGSSGGPFCAALPNVNGRLLNISA
jgi:hypothetical protein